MSFSTNVVIIGAGPYGLSIAAHLRARGIGFRIFGKLMYTWREQMPQGMMLKSDGFASNISDPTSIFTIEKYCAEQGIPYDHTKIPVSLKTFSEYGVEFQRRMVPELDGRFITALEQDGEGFRLTLEDGETLQASQVVVAVGITHFAYIPDCLSKLGPEYITHSSAHKDPSRFGGSDVAVIGGGASALDLAALLRNADANVSVITRRQAIRFHNRPDPKPDPLWKRIRNPRSGIGPGWKSRFFTDFPGLFHFLPENLRLRIVKRYLGPSAGWTVREGIEGRVPVKLGLTPRSAELRDGKVHLTLTDSAGNSLEHVADHVIAGTGYRVDLRRLKFLSPDLLAKLRTLENAPLLSPSFESSVPGLYFVGVASAFSFGPMMRFAFGARFTAFRITRKLAKESSRQSVAEPSVAVTN